MNIYETKDMSEILLSNTYPGRGIVVGTSKDGKKAMFAYFIMGRSANSRNRVFTAEGEDIVIYPFDMSKVEDPSLIIYSPVRKIGKNWIVTNGDQTDTIYDFVKEGKSFEEALDTRCFEPDRPNFTPRISAMLYFDGGFSYKMSILKSADAEGTACNRYTFAYAPVPGVGQFIHTYNCDGNPIPTFTGEPERVVIDGGVKEFAAKLWADLNEDNKVSLVACSIDIASGEKETVMYNKNA